MDPLTLIANVAGACARAVVGVMDRPEEIFGLLSLSRTHSEAVGRDRVVAVSL
jgi:hypothetical protein